MATTTHQLILNWDRISGLDLELADSASLDQLALKIPSLPHHARITSKPLQQPTRISMSTGDLNSSPHANTLPGESSPQPDFILSMVSGFLNELHHHIMTKEIKVLFKVGYRRAHKLSNMLPI